jgi:hypothetical protein
MRHSHGFPLGWPDLDKSLSALGFWAPGGLGKPIPSLSLEHLRQIAPSELKPVRGCIGEAGVFLVSMGSTIGL